MYIFEIDFGYSRVTFSGDINDLKNLNKAIKKRKVFYKVDGDKIYLIPTSKMMYIEIKIKKG